MRIPSAAGRLRHPPLARQPENNTDLVGEYWRIRCGNKNRLRRWPREENLSIRLAALGALDQETPKRRSERSVSRNAAQRGRIQ